MSQNYDEIIEPRENDEQRAAREDIPQIRGD